MAEGQKPGIFNTLSRLMETALATVQTRLELFAVELQEEKWNVVQVLALAAFTVVLALMTLASLSFLIILAFWEENRMAATITLTALYLAATVGTGWGLQVKLKRWRAFSSTLGELKKDRECLTNWRNSKSGNAPS